MQRRNSTLGRLLSSFGLKINLITNSALPDDVLLIRYKVDDEVRTLHIVNLGQEPPPCQTTPARPTKRKKKSAP